MIVKEQRVYAFRVPETYRDIEDWRKDSADQRHGPWAVHCLNHDQRTFFPTYAKAKDLATLPAACPVCDAFDRRCIYCPSDSDQWLADRNTGYVPSAGHIAGNAVCLHHRYGRIPEGIEYEEKRDAPGGRAIVEIVVENTEGRSSGVTVAFRPDERAYCVQCHFAAAEWIAPEPAAEYSRAFNFALSIAASLNVAAEREASATGVLPACVPLFGYFETWEQVAARNASSK